MINYFDIDTGNNKNTLKGNIKWIRSIITETNNKLKNIPDI